MASQSNVKTFFGGFATILEKQWQCDVRLRAVDSDEGAYIFAHKLILAGRSEVFRLMFEPDECKSSSKQEIVILWEMKHEEIEALVEFIYSDGSTLSAKGKQNVRSLFTAAHKYEITHLRYLCTTELISSLRVTNALDILKLSQIPFERHLNTAAVCIILKNFKTIANSKEFKMFVIEKPDLAVEIVKTLVN